MFLCRKACLTISDDDSVQTPFSGTKYEIDNFKIHILIGLFALHYMLATFLLGELLDVRPVI